MSERVFADGALPSRTKQLIAVAHVTQCPYCIKGHTKAAARQGATQREVMEAIWVAAEMRAGGYARSAISLTTMDEEHNRFGRRAPEDGQAALAFDLPAGDRVQRRRTQRLARAQAEAVQDLASERRTATDLPVDFRASNPAADRRERLA